MFVLVLYVTMVYGPIAALLVELFPARIRYSAMSLPYHIGNGWFGGFLPTTAFAIVAATGNIYYGLWYPIVVAGATVVIGLFFLPKLTRRASTPDREGCRGEPKIGISNIRVGIAYAVELTCGPHLFDRIVDAHAKPMCIINP